MDDVMVHCCADCGSVEGGASLKACKSCMLVKYCNAKCQRNHWPKHKKICIRGAAELRDEALFKDPPPKEECPICLLPMPLKLIACMSLPPATISSVPIAEYAKANEELAKEAMEEYYSCCGKSICCGCIHSFCESGNVRKCPFCNADQDRTEEEQVEGLKKRVAVNDAGAMYILGSYYYHGKLELLQDREKAMELWKQAAKLGSNQAHYNLGNEYREGGELKRAKFHYKAGAIAGNEVARCNLGYDEYHAGNVERALKHWMIAASAGHYIAMNNLLVVFKQGFVSRDAINSTLTAYNNSCGEMRSKARDAYINMSVDIGRRL